MEYLKGGELFTELCKNEIYNEAVVRNVMTQLMSAVAYLHKRKVIHRDLKPENIIFSHRSIESTLKIIDFGFATIEDKNIQSKFSKHICGTPGYIAPEVLKTKKYSCKVDIWSIGVILYLMLAGIRPYEADDPNPVQVSLF